MNKCSFIGRLVADPEVRSLPTGVKVVKFRLAVEGRRYKKDGKTVRDTAYADFEAWDKGGEVLAKNFKKGQPIVVDDAELRQDDWQQEIDGQTVKRSKLYFRVNEFSWPPINPGPGKDKSKPAEVTVGGNGDEVVAPGGDDAEIPF